MEPGPWGQEEEEAAAEVMEVEEEMVGTVAALPLRSHSIMRIRASRVAPLSPNKAGMAAPVGMVV
jgi:hypothetical protein